MLSLSCWVPAFRPTRKTNGRTNHAFRSRKRKAMAPVAVGRDAVVLTLVVRMVVDRMVVDRARPDDAQVGLTNVVPDREDQDLVGEAKVVPDREDQDLVGEAKVVVVRKTVADAVA